MLSVEICIDSFEKIQDFVSIVNQYLNHFDLIQGHHVIDAKSVMGILNLDINEPMTLHIRDAGSQITDILEALKPFILNEES